METESDQVHTYYLFLIKRIQTGKQKKVTITPKTDKTGMELSRASSEASASASDKATKVKQR